MSQFQHVTPALQLVLATSHKISVFTHSGTAVVAVSVLAVLSIVTFEAPAAGFSGSTGITGTNGGPRVEVFTGSAVELEAAGTADVEEVGTGVSGGAAAFAAASRFAARTLLRCLSLGPR